MLFCAVSLFADPVTESEEYQLMMEYKALYDQAYQEGDYDQALEYAELVREYSEKVRLLAEEELARLQNQSFGLSDEQIAALHEQLDAHQAALDALGLQQIDPELYEEASALIDRMHALLNDDPESAEEAYLAAIAYLEQLEQAIRTNLANLEQLLDLAEEDLYQAEKAEAYYYAEEDIYNASHGYFEGYRAYVFLSLEECEENLNMSRFYSGQALAKSRSLGDLTDIDGLLYETAEKIDRASRRLVKDENGRVRMHEPWSPEPFLEENPLIYPEIPSDVYTGSDSILIPLPWPDNLPMADTDDDMAADDTANDDTASDDVIIDDTNIDGSYQDDFAVEGVSEDDLAGEDMIADDMADDDMIADDDMTADDMADDDISGPYAEDSLETAVSLWESGVVARNSGDFDLAREYFTQAGNFAEEARNNSEVFTITVLGPGAGPSADSLWKISFAVYGRAFYWPYIWQANKGTIDDPSLIYPGQEIILPNP
jgi:hypothetical protein